jgi:hypothetical protein
MIKTYEHRLKGMTYILGSQRRGTTGRGPRFLASPFFKEPRKGGVFLCLQATRGHI